MSYRVRFTTPSGKTGHWTAPFSTRQEAEEHAALRQMANGLSYTIEEFDADPESGSTAAHHVEILRARVKELEQVQKAMSRDLSFALQIGDAMREAMRTGEWRAGHDKSMANSAMSGWDRWKTSLAKAPSVPVGASEAPGEGGDSDRRRLGALEGWLKGHAWRRIRHVNGYGLVAESHDHGIQLAAPTLAALADKLMEKKEANP